eukprot:4171967-Ditylum_brightwellii.AAC.1
MWVDWNVHWYGFASDTSETDNEDLGTCSVVSLCHSKLSKQCGQNVISKNTDAQQPRDVFKGDSWFSSVPTAEAICKEGGACI